MEPKRQRPLEALELQILQILLGEQERFERGEWKPEWTLHSRVSYLTGKAHGALVPSPIRDKFNLERSFKLRFDRVMRRLVQHGFVRYRSIRGHDKQFKNEMGYNLHRMRNRDVVLTEVGRQTALAARAEKKAATPAAKRPAPPPMKLEVVSTPPAPPEAPKSSGFYDYVITIAVED